jgi:hypothetical protein
VLHKSSTNFPLARSAPLRLSDHPHPVDSSGSRFNHDKIVVSDSVSRSHREELLRRFRTITGWTDLAFSKEGVLQTNIKHTGGSQIARELLSRAISGPRMIVLEGASSRKDVVFCRVIIGKPDHEFSNRGAVNVIQIDFNDFRYVTGDKEARAAFDVGWAVLH